MRYLSSILAILILTLSVIPCSDAHTCDEKGQEISLEHDHSEDEKDHCSPFCVCACCGINIISQSKFAINPLIQLLSSKYQLGYSFLYSFSFHHSIWQPPTFS